MKTTPFVWTARDSNIPKNTEQSFKTKNWHPEKPALRIEPFASNDLVVTVLQSPLEYPYGGILSKIHKDTMGNLEGHSLRQSHRIHW